MRISDWSSDVCSSDLGLATSLSPTLRPSSRPSEQREREPGPMAEAGHQAQPANFDLRWRRSAAEAAPEVGPLRIVALAPGDLPRARPAFPRLLAAAARPVSVKPAYITQGFPPR